MLTIVLAAVLASAGSAFGQVAVPGGPDQPPAVTPLPPAPSTVPDASGSAASEPSTAAPSASSPSTPAASSPSPSRTSSSSSAGSSPTAAERAAAAAQRAALARERRLAAQRLRQQRARERRALTAFAAGRRAIGGDLEVTIRALDGLAEAATVTTPTSSAAPAAEHESDYGTALLVGLLAASLASAMLVVVSSLVARAGSTARIPVTGEGEASRTMAVRLPFVAGHRFELAGLSVGCLLVALLIMVGAL